MRYLLLLFLCLPILVHAQAEPEPIRLESNPDEELYDDFSEPLQHFQLELKKQAVEIKLLQYDGDKEPIEGELSEDGWTIILKDYYKKGRVYADIIYKDGTQKSFSVGSCFIDPIYEL